MTEFDMMKGETVVTGEEVAQVVKTGSESKKAQLAEMKQAFRVAMSDPNFKAAWKKLSGNIEVLNTLGFGDKGNVIVDKANPQIMNKDGNLTRNLVQTSPIEGYIIKNIGDTPIDIQVKKYQLDETGNYVGHNEVVSFAPGATMAITRSDLTRLTAQPEFSFTLANGRIARGSARRNDKMDLASELRAYYFSFNAELNKEVNSDEVKLQIGEKDETGAWVVKPEYVETFGYVMNKKARAPRGEGTKYTTSDIMANALRQMLEQEGNM